MTRDGWRAVLTGIRDWNEQIAGRIFDLILNPERLPRPRTGDMQQMIDDIELNEGGMNDQALIAAASALMPAAAASARAVSGGEAAEIVNRLGGIAVMSRPDVPTGTVAFFDRAGKLVGAVINTKEASR